MKGATKGAVIFNGGYRGGRTPFTHKFFTLKKIELIYIFS